MRKFEKGLALDIHNQLADQPRPYLPRATWAISWSRTYEVWVDIVEHKPGQSEEEVDQAGSPERECKPEEACSPSSQETSHRSNRALW